MTLGPFVFATSLLKGTEGLNFNQSLVYYSLAYNYHLETPHQQSPPLPVLLHAITIYLK